jgi:hypothetical protein
LYDEKTVIKFILQLKRLKEPSLQLFKFPHHLKYPQNFCFGTNFERNGALGGGVEGRKVPY